MKSCAHDNGRPIVVIGYGNDLRGDDGLGPAVATRLQVLQWPGVRVLSVQQLTPELAGLLAEARRVIFVDAELSGEAGVRARQLDTSYESAPTTHASSPQSLLALTHEVYGRSPEAWLVTVPGFRFDLETVLSAEAQRYVEPAVAAVRDLCTVQTCLAT